jgi:hypothetical protein
MFYESREERKRNLSFQKKTLRFGDFFFSMNFESMISTTSISMNLARIM